MKTLQEAFKLVSSSLYQSTPKELLSVIEEIQKDAFKAGRVRGLEDAMGELRGGTPAWVTLNKRLHNSTH